MERWAGGDTPAVHLCMEGEGVEGVEYEYSYRLDGMPWSAWTQDSHVVIQDEALLLQAKHEVEARARVVGERNSVDPTPAYQEIIVDLLAPQVVLQPDVGGTRVIARDVVSPYDLEMRWRMPGLEWSAWERLESEDPLLPSEEVEVEVRDEVENVGSASNALIRGRPNPAAADGACACALPGQDDNRPLAGLILLGLVVGLRTRREVNS